MNDSKAAHNESVCDFLLHGGRWPDWVVTTAFYSALHTVREKLFPLSVGDVTYTHFEDYCVEDHPGARQDKHQVLLSLVFENLRPAYDSYRFLLYESKKARYNTYCTPPPLAVKSRQHLEVVKSHC